MTPKSDARTSAELSAEVLLLASAVGGLDASPTMLRRLFREMERNHRHGDVVKLLAEAIASRNDIRRPEDFDKYLLPILDPKDRLRLISSVVDALDRLDSGDLDIVLVAARRMACLYQLLRERGLHAPARGVVMSDRFIELLPDGAWAGKKVLVLDDTRVSGQTMESRLKAAERLVGVGEKVEQAVALEIGPNERERSFQLHRQFAMAFAQNLVPFFTDFPVSNEITFSFEQFGRLLGDGGWRVVEVTNEVIGGSGARAYTLFPREPLAAELAKALGAASSVAETIKIRLYSKEDASGVRFRIVPLVLPMATTESSLQEWLRARDVAANGSGEQAEHALGAVALVMSRAVLKVLSGYFQTNFVSAVSEDKTFAQVTLGPDVQDVVRRATIASLRVLKAAAFSDEGVVREPSFRWPNGHPDGQSHFTVLGDDAVLPGYGLLHRDQVSTDNGVERHTTTMRHMADFTGANLVSASLAIDVLNDVGYSVPVQVCKDGTVFRAYRRGEAAPSVEELKAGLLGGRIAAVPTTEEIPDDEYFEVDELAALLTD